MSHIAVRIVAQALVDETNGVNAIAARMPRDGDDPAPPAVTIYDETNDGWVARDAVPQPNDTIAFPAIIVFLQAAAYDGGPVDTEDTGARSTGGTVQIACQLLMQDSQTNRMTTAGMYLLRAMHSALRHLDEAENDDFRTRLGVRLRPSSRMTQGRLDAPRGDSVASLGAWICMYDTVETTDLLPSA